MKNNVINLFGDENIDRNEGEKYSQLLNDFMTPFLKDFPEDLSVDEVFEFSVNVWNTGNMSLIVPEEEFDKILSSNNLEGDEGKMLMKMIDYKKSHFAQYDRFIIDYEVTEEEEGRVKITVVTQHKEAFLEELLNESQEFQHGEADFDEGYINRQAIVLRPKQPFFDWLNGLGEDDPWFIEEAETIVYLVSDEVEDPEKWLRKKFDKFFMMVLEDWHLNKKEWPQNRSYKMFKQWFHVQTSTLIYDMEKKPVSKEDDFDCF